MGVFDPMVFSNAAAGAMDFGGGLAAALVLVGLLAGAVAGMVFAAAPAARRPRRLATPRLAHGGLAAVRAR